MAHGNVAIQAHHLRVNVMNKTGAVTKKLPKTFAKPRKQEKICCRK